MLIREIRIVAIATLMIVGIALSADAQTGRHTPYAYLPLQEGNVWRYVNTSGPVPAVQEVRVTERITASEPEVFRVENYCFGIAPGSLHFSVFNGALHEYDQGAFHVFYPWSNLDQPFQLPEGNDCMHGATGVFDGIAPITVPIGLFEDALTIRYTDLLCVDSGPWSETFVPGIGLVERKVLSMHGVETWSLVSAEVDGRIYGDSDLAQAATSTEPRQGSNGEERSTWSGIKARYR